MPCKRNAARRRYTSRVAGNQREPWTSRSEPERARNDLVGDPTGKMGGRSHRESGGLLLRRGTGTGPSGAGKPKSIVRKRTRPCDGVQVPAEPYSGEDRPPRVELTGHNVGESLERNAHDALASMGRLGRHGPVGTQAKPRVISKGQLRKWLRATETVPPGAAASGGKPLAPPQAQAGNVAGKLYLPHQCRYAISRAWGRSLPAGVFGDRRRLLYSTPAGELDAARR